MLPTRNDAAESKIDLTPILEEATQPVVITVTNPELQQMFSDTTQRTRFPSAYIGNNLQLFPIIASYRNFYGKEIVMIDLANIKNHSWAIELFAFFKLTNNDVVTVNTKGVQIWRIKKIADCDAPCLKEIPLPQELVQLFTKDHRSDVKPFSIKMFPDGQHLGILYSNRDFYLVNLTNGAVIKFSFGQGLQEENSRGFLPKSAHEINLCINGVWQKATLDHEKREAISKPQIVDSDFPLMQDRNPLDFQDDHVHTLDRFSISEQVAGIRHDCTVSTQTDNAKFMRLASASSTCVFPNFNMFCYFPFGTNNALTVVSDDPQQLHERVIPLTRKSGPPSRLVQCDNQAVLKWDNVANDTKMTVCFFPGSQKLVSQHLPLIASLVRIVTDYVNFPSTPCEFLTTKKAPNTSVVSYSLFQPAAKAFQPDWKQINTWQDVLKTLENFKEMDDNGNVRFVFEGAMLRHFQSKINYYLLALKFFQSMEDIRGFCRNPALFVDPKLFAQDFVSFLETGLDEYWDESTVQHLEHAYAKELAANLIKKYQLDKLAQRAQEVLVAENTATAQASAAAAAKP